MRVLKQVLVGKTNHLSDTEPADALDFTYCGKGFSAVVRAVDPRRIKGATKCRQCRRAVVRTALGVAA
jgi:hypothetical protein